jgi:hypothetical protein
MTIDFTGALDAAHTLARVDDIASSLWRAYAAGGIADADAERVGAAIEEARKRIRPVDTVAVRAPSVPRLRSSFPPRRRRCTSPDRLASRDRRRRLAYSGPLPHALATRFTTGQLAVLRIVADEIRLRGLCVLPLNAIAARAGVCVTLARAAIRLAAGDGLLVITERRRRGCPSLPNVLRVISSEWRMWIAKWGRPADRVQFVKPHEDRSATPHVSRRFDRQESFPKRKRRCDGRAPCAPLGLV